MNRFLANSAVALVLNLKDRLGNEVGPISVTFDIVDRSGAVILKQQPAPFTVGEKSVSITIPPNANLLSVNSYRELRTVRLNCVMDSNDNLVYLTSSYVIEANDLLIVGVNSFLTLDEAEMIVMDMQNLGDWDIVSDDEKSAALIDSRNRLCRLTYSLLDISRPQESVSYVPEGIIGISKGMSPWNIKNQLGDLTVEQYNLLPEKFKRALRYAQVADSLDTLTPDKVAEKRAQGLILDTIGETKQMFTSSRPVESHVSKRAMRYLSEFVIGSTLKTGRS